MATVDVLAHRCRGFRAFSSGLLPARRPWTGLTTRHGVMFVVKPLIERTKTINRAFKK